MAMVSAVACIPAVAGITEADGITEASLLLLTSIMIQVFPSVLASLLVLASPEVPVFSRAMLATMQWAMFSILLMFLEFLLLLVSLMLVPPY
jgi:hypothetical protein